MPTPTKGRRLGGSAAHQQHMLANLATVNRTATPPVYSHYNVAPVIDVYGGVSGRDLGGVLHDIRPLIAEAEKALIMVTLQHTKNNKTRAAEILGISLKTLFNKLKEYGQEDKDKGASAP